MRKIFHFFLKTVLRPFLPSGVKVSLFNPDPVKSFLSAYWSELLNQIDKAKSKKHTSLYPTYYLYFSTFGHNYAGRLTDKGSLIDPLGNVYSYGHAGGSSEAFNFKNSFEDSELDQLYFETEEVHQLTQEISRGDLLRALSICKKEKTKHNNKEINLKKVVRNIKRYGYSASWYYSDVPVDYSYVLVFDENKDVYKRIRIDGSKSSYISNFISKFKYLTKP
mgnify:FL=1|tara:strand:- start:67 stop:729 length:663 start_codon:yes stop_codon:yes gene_type:complete